MIDLFVKNSNSPFKRATTQEYGSNSLLNRLDYILVFLVTDFVWRSNDPHIFAPRNSLRPLSHVVGGYRYVHSRDMSCYLD